MEPCSPGSKRSQNSEPCNDGDCTCEDEKYCYRYAAYANRLKTIARAASRYLAYTSDVGESFRPVVPASLVRLGYCVSWSYIATDVSYQSWKAKMRQEGRYIPGLMPWSPKPEPDHKAAALAAQDEHDWRVVAVKELTFQSIASMALPAFTIHTVVANSGFLFKNMLDCKARRYGPVFIGLSVVPFLPYIFDKPVENAIEWIADQGEDLYQQRHNKPKK